MRSHSGFHAAGGERRLHGPRVVALGGGHGLAAALRALRHLSDQLTGIVTVADDGGSSGRLREEFGVLPPGDLRMALSALCDDRAWGRLWRDVLQHRFKTNGPLDQHSMGNLLIVALWELLGDPVEGLDRVGELLGARGRVLPMAAVPLDIEADVLAPDGTPTIVRGQYNVATTSGRVEQVRLVPADPPARPEAVRAVLDAEWVVLGPGSWYTSVIPHLLVPELSKALHTTSAHRALTLNLSAQAGETSGYGAHDHLEALAAHAPDLRIDVVIADPVTVEDVGALTAAAEAFGARVLLRQVRKAAAPAKHDPLRLAAAYRDAFDSFLGDVGTVAG